MMDLITRTATSRITRVTGAHFYARTLADDLLLRGGMGDTCVPIERERNRRFVPYGWRGKQSEDALADTSSYERQGWKNQDS